MSMGRFVGGLALSVLVFLGGSWVLAQPPGVKVEIAPQPRPAPEATVPPAPAPGARADLVRVSQVMGAHVSIANNLGIGTVADLLMNADGDVDYLVVLNEDKYVLVPWNAAQVNYQSRTVLVDLPQERFREIPTFTRAEWPNLSDVRYFQRIRSFYNGPPTGRERRGERREDRRDNRRP